MLSPMFILNCIRSRLVPINSNLSAKNGWSGDSPGPIRSLFVSILFLNVHCSAWLPSLQCWLMRNCSFFECEQILHYQIRWKFFRLLQELLIRVNLLAYELEQMVLSSSHFISRRTLGTVDEVLLLVKSIYSIVITAVGLFSILNRVRT